MESRPRTPRAPQDEYQDTATVDSEDISVESPPLIPPKTLILIQCQRPMAFVPT